MVELKRILENAKLTAEKIEANLMHPMLNTTDYKPRDFFYEITDISDDYFGHKSITRMIGLAGLRGVGKTTLLWQSANYIFKNYTENMYFFHMGLLKKFDVGVHEIHNAIEKYIVHDKLWSYKEKMVILFDEVHEDPHWSSSLKILYDLFHSVFVIATGSSALLLRSTTDLVTRMYIQQILPLSFSEYIGFTHDNIPQIKDLGFNLKKILFHSENTDELFNDFQNIKPELDNFIDKIDNLGKRIYDYVVYHNIIRFLLRKSKFQIISYTHDLIGRVIYEDISKLSENALKPTNAEKILTRLAASDEINVQSLSQAIGISQDEINQNLKVLVKSELINVLYPYGGIDSKINKTRKYFFMSPTVRKAILSEFINTDTDDVYAKMLEDTVVTYFKRVFRRAEIISFASAKGQKNPDFIIETLPKHIILEVGINKNKIKQITESKIDHKYGIIVNSKADKPEFTDKNVLILPLKYFLML